MGHEHSLLEGETLFLLAVSRGAKVVRGDGLARRGTRQGEVRKAEGREGDKGDTISKAIRPPPVRAQVRGLTSFPPVMRRTYPLNSSPSASAATSWDIRFS